MYSSPTFIIGYERNNSWSKLLTSALVARNRWEAWRWQKRIFLPEMWAIRHSVASGELSSSIRANVNRGVKCIALSRALRLLGSTPGYILPRGGFPSQPGERARVAPWNAHFVHSVLVIEHYWYQPLNRSEISLAD